MLWKCSHICPLTQTWPISSVGHARVKINCFSNKWEIQQKVWNAQHFVPALLPAALESALHTLSSRMTRRQKSHFSLAKAITFSQYMFFNYEKLSLSNNYNRSPPYNGNRRKTLSQLPVATTWTKMGERGKNIIEMRHTCLILKERTVCA